jgi:Asp-tRNA(Asn)/Glu-tRNA(Gln) amidotransferase A subunit family amidase
MVLVVLNGADLQDRSSIDAPFNFDAETDISRIRLGYLPEAFGEGANEVDRAALAAARGLGIEVVEVRLPDLPYDALMNILYAEAAAAFEELTLDDVDDTLKWQDDGAWPNTFRKARFLSAVDHVQLDRLRYQVMLALEGLFAEIDALIGPFKTGPMLVASNFTGHPCLHLRSGFLDLPARGMASLAAGKLTIGKPQASRRTFNVPQGISLWGRLFEEGVILNLGLVLERELAVAGARPGLPC